MDWTTLTGSQSTAGSIRRLVNNPTIDVDAVLEDAQAEIYTRLRVREMRKETTLSLVQSDISVALPTRFLDPIAMRDRFGSDILQVDEDALEAMRVKDDDGDWIEAEPSRYAIWAEAIQFDYAMDAARSFRFIYFEKPADLSVSNTTNFITTRYPHLMRAACEKYAYIFLKQPDAAAGADSRMTMALERIAQSDDLSRRGMILSER